MEEAPLGWKALNTDGVDGKGTIPMVSRSVFLQEANLGQRAVLSFVVRIIPGGFLSMRAGCVVEMPRNLAHRPLPVR